MSSTEVHVRLVCRGRGAHGFRGLDRLHRDTDSGVWSSGWIAALGPGPHPVRQDKRGTWRLECKDCRVPKMLSELSMTKFLDLAVAAGVSEIDLAALHL